MVSRRSKALAVFTIVALNFFFVYYTILHAYQRGYDWQIGFLWSCIAQVSAWLDGFWSLMVIETFVYFVGSDFVILGIGLL